MSNPSLRYIAHRRAGGRDDRAHAQDRLRTVPSTTTARPGSACRRTSSACHGLGYLFRFVGEYLFGREEIRSDIFLKKTTVARPANDHGKIFRVELNQLDERPFRTKSLFCYLEHDANYNAREAEKKRRKRARTSRRLPRGRTMRYTELRHLKMTREWSAGPCTITLLLRPRI